MNLSEQAQAIIAKISYLNIASVTPKGEPWNTPVFCGHDGAYNFYWASWTENQHSQNIRQNPNVFLTIYDSTVPVGEGEAVYVKAKVTELNDANEIAHALIYLSKGRPARPLEEFLPPNPRRIYKAVPEKVWINVDGQVDGMFVDQRVEVKL